MNKIIISPSILSADFANLERDIKRAEVSGADWLHIDVMDGHFVPNITIGVPVTASIKKITELPLDVHLMIENPQKYIEPFAKAGADILTFHYEAVNSDEDIFKLISYIKSFNIKAGMSIKPKTSADKCFQFLPELDMLLVMTVEPGFGGQKFIENALDKVSRAKELILKRNSSAIVEVDGGVNLSTGKQLVEAGADALVAGSFVFGSPNPVDTIQDLKKL